jgi:hypothetical protein
MSKHGKSAGRADLPKYDPNDVVIIGLDTDDGPQHYLCDEESNKAPLNESSVLFTMVHGVLQPPVGERDGEKVVIVAGRGRTRLLREANARLVKEGNQPWSMPVIIKRGDEATMISIRAGENLHRRTISPMWRARQAQDLLDKGKSKPEVAATIGVDTGQLDNVLKLLSLAPSVGKAVVKGDLSATAAVQLADMPRDEQETQLKELLANGKPTVKDTINKVRKAKGQDAVETPKDRINKAIAVLDKLEDDATKDDLWSAVKRIRKALDAKRA